VYKRQGLSLVIALNLFICLGFYLGSVKVKKEPFNSNI